MSFFENPDIPSFLSNIRTPQKKYPKNISFFRKNENRQKKLSTSKNPRKKAKKIFHNNENIFEDNGIFSFRNNESNDIKNINNCYNIASNGFDYGNPFENQNNEQIFHQNNIFNNFNDCTIGKIFDGKYIKINNEKMKFMNITSLPEYDHGSNEEFRMADLEMKKTGNIFYYKIKNTSSKNNIFSTNKMDINKNNSYRNNIFTENSRNINTDTNNISENIFNKKLESKIFDFSNKKDKGFTLFKSNIIDNTLTNNILFGKKNINYNSPFSYFGNNNAINNTNLKVEKSNLGNINQKNNINLFSFGNNNFNDHYSSETNLNTDQKELNNYLTDEDAYNLFSPNGKLSKEINEAIQNGKTVKDFLDDLKKKYSNFEKSDDNNKKSSIIQNNSEILDLYGSYLSQNSNGISSIQKNKINDDLSPIKLRNSINDKKYFNMEIEDEFNFDKLSSKINEIYKDYDKSNINYNKDKYINDSQKLKNNIFDSKPYINTKNDKLNDNENYFNKTFSNGFYNYKSLLNNDSFSNTNNSCNQNSNILLGKDEYLYQQNLQAFNKLSISNINLNENNNNELSQIFYNDYNIFNGNHNNSLENEMKEQNIDLIVKYHLPIEENKDNIKKKIKYYNLILKSVNASIKVKDFKEKIKSEILEYLRNKNIFNYSIEKIGLLYSHGFLLDNMRLLDYKFENYNYTIHSVITYKKNIELAPLELVPKLSKPGYKSFPCIKDLCRKSCEELKTIKNFKIMNQFGEVEFKEPINLLGVNLDNEITIEKNMIDTGDKLNYWSIFKLYNFILDKNDVNIYISQLERSGGKFLSYKNNVLVWEYKVKRGVFK